MSSEQTKAQAGSDQAGADQIGAEQVPHRRKLVGRVKSAKMQKTVVVETIRTKIDPVYKKYVRVRQRYKAHDANGEYRVGDRVEIAEHRPLSREKRWIVTRLIERPVTE